jgi:hypothetical protein
VRKVENGSYSVAGFGINGVEPLDSAVRKLAN